jgi:type IV pilus biogenesis protein CpaD/CtpE
VVYKSEEASIGTGSHVANDRSRFTSRESDCASNVTQVARRQGVDRNRIIHVEKSCSFDPILSQNSYDGYQVRFDPPCVRWLELLRANSESRVVSSVGCRITCVKTSKANFQKIEQVYKFYY